MGFLEGFAAQTLQNRDYAQSMAYIHAANVLPIIRQIAAGGASLRNIADELNARGIKTARGGLWYAGTVRNMLTRVSNQRAAA